MNKTICSISNRKYLIITQISLTRGVNMSTHTISSVCGTQNDYISSTIKIINTVERRERE